MAFKRIAFIILSNKYLFYIFRQKMQSFSIDNSYAQLSTYFQEVEDHRSPVNTKISLKDVLMSGFALFSLKDRSLLKFTKEYKTRASNLKSIYGIENLPSDTAMRQVLDKVESKNIQSILAKFINQLIQSNHLIDYEIFGGYLYIPIDGTTYFTSQKVHCEKCLQTHHQNQTITYHDKGLVATLVHPEQKEVFPVAIEAIVKQDGQTKNDSELAATERLFPSIKSALPAAYPVLIGGDALFACASFLNRIIAYNWDFLLSIKEGNQPFPFKQFEQKRKAGQVTRIKKVRHRKNTKEIYEYVNDLILNEDNPDIKVNFIRYQQLDLQTGEILQEFTWITSIYIDNKNIKTLVLTGRARWKIENETFNTLKNQGYDFEHNFGHGKQFLADNFAILMLLAFLIDQIAQRLDKQFKKAWITANTKIDLWEKIRIYFDLVNCDSMNIIYKIIAKEIKVKIQIQHIDDS